MELTIAVVRKTQGRKGEVAAEILTDFPERFGAMISVRVVKPTGTGSRLPIESFWFHKGAVILKFSGIDSISDAETLVGSEVRIAREEARKLSGNQHYIFELVGCRVVDDHNGNWLGVVAEIVVLGGKNLLAVKTQGGETLIPFAEEICCRIDPQQQEIRVRLPEGLLELNA